MTGWNHETVQDDAGRWWVKPHEGPRPPLARRGADPARDVPIPEGPVGPLDVYIPDQATEDGSAADIRRIWGPELLAKQRAFYEKFADDILAGFAADGLPVDVTKPGYLPERRGRGFVDPVTGEVYPDFAAACEARPLWCLVFVPDASPGEQKMWRAAGHADVSARPALKRDGLARRTLAGATRQGANEWRAFHAEERQRPERCTTCGGLGSAGGCLACGVVGPVGWSFCDHKAARS